MAKRKRYTAKELDAMTERLIARGEDLHFTHKGQRYVTDIKMLAAEREYNKGTSKIKI